MTIYSEMLRLALAEDAARDDADRPITKLVEELLSQRSRLLVSAGQSATGNVADRLGDALSYDIALIKLCDRLSIDHDFNGERASADTRRRMEEALGDQLPSVAAALSSTSVDSSPQ